MSPQLLPPIPVASLCLTDTNHRGAAKFPPHFLGLAASPVQTLDCVVLIHWVKTMVVIQSQGRVQRKPFVQRLAHPRPPKVRQNEAAGVSVFVSLCLAKMSGEARPQLEAPMFHMLNVGKWSLNWGTRIQIREHVIP